MTSILSGPGGTRDPQVRRHTVAARHPLATGVEVSIALPRELSPGGRRTLADDLRAAFVDRYPHSWAIHSPLASDGLLQPHVHIQFSMRGWDEERGLSAADWFRQPWHEPLRLRCLNCVGADIITARVIYTCP